MTGKKIYIGIRSTEIYITQQFEKQIPSYECGSNASNEGGLRDGDSKTFQSEKHFCVKRFSDCVFQWQTFGHWVAAGLPGKFPLFT